MPSSDKTNTPNLNAFTLWKQGNIYIIELLLF